MKYDDNTVYYTVIGGIENYRNNYDSMSDEDLDSIECRLKVEIAYWQVKKDIRKCTALTEYLMEVSDVIAERQILEGK